MFIQFSRSTGSFYPIDIDYGDKLPSDVIKIAESDFQTAIAARAAGDAFDFINGALVITPAPAATLDQVRAAKLTELSAAFSSRMAIIKAGYPDEEIQSWFDQKSEAVAFTADPNAATPLLSAMAVARGITVADLVARVLANGAAWSTISGALIGKRQAYEDMVAAAQDGSAVSVIEWKD